ncbi:hypothetical protein ABC337_08385 [Arthrobacter sp. 1P04PC]|uniref:hypothetical protein n=1 Tax=unclassified Arthrobacter TaxID=235627 RepID=UPI0039A2627B
MTEHQDHHTAEAEASSRDPHDWGRAMALALTRLAEQLDPEGGEDMHTTLVNRPLQLQIRDDGEGVTITVSTA